MPRGRQRDPLVGPAETGRKRLRTDCCGHGHSDLLPLPPAAATGEEEWGSSEDREDRDRTRVSDRVSGDSMPSMGRGERTAENGAANSRKDVQADQPATLAMHQTSRPCPSPQKQLQVPQHRRRRPSQCRQALEFRTSRTCPASCHFHMCRCYEPRARKQRWVHKVGRRDSGALE